MRLLFRILIPVILFSLFFLFFKNKLAPLKHEVWKMLLFGGLHGFILLGYFIAVKYLTIASAVLLLYTFPIWMIIFSNLILKEKLTKKEILALIISFVGVVILLSPENFFIKESLIGSIARLLAGVGAGLVYVLSKSFKKYDNVSLTFWQNLIALPFILPLLFIKFPKFFLVSNLEITLILCMGIISLISFIFVFKGLGKVKANKGGIIMLLETIWPIILALLIFKEIPSISTYIEGILIIIGAYISIKH